MHPSLEMINLSDLHYVLKIIFAWKCVFPGINKSTQDDLMNIYLTYIPSFSFLSLCFRWVTVVGFLVFISVWIHLFLNEAFPSFTFIIIITLILDFFLPSYFIFPIHSTFSMFSLLFFFFFLYCNLVCVFFSFNFYDALYVKAIYSVCFLVIVILDILTSILNISKSSQLTILHSSWTIWRS